MNERNERNGKNEPETATGTVTPPPFRQNEAPQEAAQQEEQDTSPTLADRIAALGLEEPIADQLTHLTEGIDSDAMTSDLLATLARGLTHDNDVQNADAAGYLRGRNENIEAVLHPQPVEETPPATPVFPRYCRRSIWD